MPVHNSDVEEIFNRVADLLEIKGENPFRVRAYRNAARAVAGLSHSAADMIAAGEDLTQLPGIGKDLAGKIEQIVKTGALPLLADLRKEVPGELSDLMKIPGLGARRVAALHDQLGVTTLDELEQAARDGRIRRLAGFGKKTEQRILDELGRRHGEETQRIKLATAEQIAGPLVDYLKRTKGVREVVVAGSFRRRRETVADLDILAACTRGSNVMDRFVEYDEVDRVIAKGDTRSTVVLRSGLQVDLRVVQQVSYGAALMYFTGSKQHNIALRTIGLRKKLKINEYGVFKGRKRVAGRTEEEVYGKIGLPYIEPELREDRGEVEAAQKGTLPNLVKLEDIRGDLHVHTNRTDGPSDQRTRAVSGGHERGHEGCSGQRLRPGGKRASGPPRSERHALQDGQRYGGQGCAVHRHAQTQRSRFHAIWRRSGAARLAGSGRCHQYQKPEGAQEASEEVEGHTRTRSMDFKKNPKLNFKEVGKLSEAEARDEIDALREGIECHDCLYYVKDRPEISDETYDKLFRRLQELGEDISRNVRTIGAVPLHLRGGRQETPSFLAVRGEVFMRKDDFQKLNRKRIVESMGGRVASSVSGETDFVVAGDRPRSKLNEASDRGVKVIDEKRFKKLVHS